MKIKNILSVLNVANGNNLSIAYMKAQDNPDLTCIKKIPGSPLLVMVPGSKDDTASYSTDCSGVR